MEQAQRAGEEMMCRVRTTVEQRRIDQSGDFCLRCQARQFDKSGRLLTAERGESVDPQFGVVQPAATMQQRRGELKMLRRIDALGAEIVKVRGVDQMNIV